MHRAYFLLDYLSVGQQVGRSKKKGGPATLAAGFVVSVLFASPCSLGNTGSLTVENKTPPTNVLLICVDDLKPTLGCYGDPIAKTPNLDKLASRGLRFDSAYCNQAVCSPSRNSLLTGLRPQTIGIYDLATNFRHGAGESKTLPQFFREHGYESASLGKIFHVGHGNKDDAPSWSVPSFRPNAPRYVTPESSQDSRPGRNGPKGAAIESAEVEDEQYADGLVAKEAIARLQNAKENASSQPFFLAVGFVKPHLPFVAPKKYWDLYDPQTIELAKYQKAPEKAPVYATTNFGELRGYRDIPEKGPVPEETQRSLIHGYYAATSYTDAQIGKVLDELDRLDLTKNTVVVVWGDHGWHLGDHGQWCKHSNYEQATRIPLLIAAPERPKSSTIEGKPKTLEQRLSTNAIIESVDIFPTLCELAQIAPPVSLDGKSYAPVVWGEQDSIRDHAISVYPRTAPEKGPVIGRAIRTARYRFVEWKPIGAGTEQADYELYDYVRDPLETRNIYEEEPEVVEELKKKLASHPEAKVQWKPQAEGTAIPSSAASNTKADRNKMFERRDRDSDGKLTKEEFLANQRNQEQAEKRFAQFDKNQDGSLSRQEFVEMGR